MTTPAQPCDAQELHRLAQQVIAGAAAAGVQIGTAESCTGGLIAATLTEIAGASAVFKGAVVSYANSVKQGVLGVSAQTLATDGAVSERTAVQMARGACQTLEVDYAVSVTGVAGPQGGTAEKPVGTVWLAVAHADEARAERYRFDGNREQIRQASVQAALTLLLGSL